MNGNQSKGCFFCICQVFFFPNHLPAIIANTKLKGKVIRANKAIFASPNPFLISWRGVIDSLAEIKREG